MEYRDLGGIEGSKVKSGAGYFSREMDQKYVILFLAALLFALALYL